jgi:hypothetical protein
MNALLGLWQAEYPALREPARARAAHAHVTGTLRRLPGPYGWAVRAALRIVPGWAWRARMPGVRQLLAATTTLALYAAFEGVTTDETETDRLRRPGDRVRSGR